MSETASDREPLMVLDAACPAVPVGSRRGLERAFNVSILVSGVRCTLSYVVLPFMVPILGLAPGIGPGLGFTIGAVAVVFNVLSMRRFWLARHRWRKPVIAIHTGMIMFLLVLMTIDGAALLG